jgi:hypothetical protein
LLGDSAVNGDYSPHFQIIKNMGTNFGAGLHKSDLAFI